MTASHRPSGGVAVAATDWHWRHAGRSRWALSGLDLTIEPGERVLLLGASGSGKSTLMQGLAGLLDSDEDGDESGALLVDGAAPAHSRSRIGMVLQNPDAQVILSRVGDDVAFGMENFRVPREEIWPRARRALAAVGLELPVRHDTSHLSGGQKQRLALAGVLAMNPGLLLLDEPTANLDPAGVGEVRDAVASAVEQSGSTLIVIEHRTAVWLPVVDRVIVLGGDGRVVADGAPAGVLDGQREELRRAGVWVPGLELPAIPRDRAPGPALLAAADLSVGYPSGPSARMVDFEIARGTTTVVTGPNGAGKSALALTLGGLLPPRGGRLDAERGFAPSPHRRDPLRWRSRELLTRIGSVFQNPEHQFLTGSVLDELALGPRALKRDPATVTAVCDELLERLHLTDLAQANPYTLSGGEQRRLSVATVLATRPEMIILDEPTFGQDRITWEELLRLLADIADQGTAVVAVTHDADFATLLADQRIDLHQLNPDAVAVSR
ncbi:ABC transporter ATP-binding protein [Mycolicibacterium chubuense]|uniref:Putative HMP/thiamine import ATP-binding protein YkoD n=1 Tax=Mycolicibacterium chubuense TaxID=1800 RepID=A0A0J6VV34_MYCCU|nr:ATP-binding cassette domain-containing protein [Mycolicibacterium chubuense]KMO73307.1 putative HMP/thiamine import ATP-binding protein YkoD [Mycolicibacterium chubuense]ORA56698.1 ABC transporter ATP-binding protein [Mycolicibacterium chubuense]SPX98841.1 ABC transporter [Mycolicibacterium chubuense]